MNLWLSLLAFSGFSLAIATIAARVEARPGASDRAWVAAERLETAAPVALAVMSLMVLVVAS